MGWLPRNEDNTYIEQILGFRIRKQVKIILLGILVGAIISTFFTPLFVAPIQATQIKTGIVSPPDPQVDLWYTENHSKIESVANYSSSGEEVMYGVRIKNPSQKYIRSFTMDLFFPGCIEKQGVYYSNLDTVFLSDTTDEIAFTRNEITEEPTVQSFEINEIPPQRSIIVYFVINTTERCQDKTQVETEKDFKRQDLVYSIMYDWPYNGRVYVSTIPVEGVRVTGDFPDKSDKIQEVDDNY